MAGRTDIIEIHPEKILRMRSLHVHFPLFDLRNAVDYSAGHIEGALNIPASEFLEKLKSMVPTKDTPVVVYDKDGSSAVDLILASEKLGYTNLVNLEGGYEAWLLTKA